MKCSKLTETSVKYGLSECLILPMTIITTTTKTCAGQLQDKVPFHALKGFYSPLYPQDILEEINFRVSP